MVPGDQVPGIPARHVVSVVRTPVLSWVVEFQFGGCWGARDVFFEKGKAGEHGGRGRMFFGSGRASLGFWK